MTRPFKAMVIFAEALPPRPTAIKQQRCLTGSAQGALCLIMFNAWLTSDRCNNCLFTTEDTHKACHCQNSVCLTDAMPSLKPTLQSLCRVLEYSTRDLSLSTAVLSGMITADICAAASWESQLPFILVYLHTVSVIMPIWSRFSFFKHANPATD